MSETPRPPSPTVVQASLQLGSQVVTSLAPQFLALLVINAFFLGGLGWFLDARAKATIALVNQLLTVCLKDRGIS